MEAQATAERIRSTPSAAPEGGENMMGATDSCSPSTTFEVEQGQDGLSRGESVGSPRRSRVVESVNVGAKERSQISPAPSSLREATALEPNANGRIVVPKLRPPKLRPRQATAWNIHSHKTRAANRFAQATHAGVA